MGVGEKGGRGHNASRAPRPDAMDDADWWLNTNSLSHYKFTFSSERCAPFAVEDDICSAPFVHNCTNANHNAAMEPHRH